MLWKLKGCPRCQGDLYLDKDYYSWHEQCLQCGYTNELEHKPERHPQTSKRGKSTVLVA